MLTLDEARARLLATATRVGRQRVALADALGRVLAEPVEARAPMPPFDASAMDGYALASGALSGEGPFTLPVKGESRTGAPAPRLEPRTACRIFTGAELPAGADAVIMQEHVVRDGDAIRFDARPKPWGNVRRAGEDLAAGAIAMQPGSRLEPGHLALAASLERAELVVSRRPLVTVLCTGDELRAAGEPPRPASIPESNGVAIAAMARRAGAEARIGPIVRDDADGTRAAIEEALVATDLLVTVGGVSVGDHDVVKPALEAAGVAIDFWRVAMKPGKPLAVGRRERAHVLGLPGNPASAMVTFALFGVPLLRAMQGDAHPVAAPLRAKLGRRIERRPGRTEFLRSTLEVEQGELVVRPLGNQASGAVTSMAWGDALAVVPLEAEVLEAGAVVDVLRLRDA